MLLKDRAETTILLKFAFNVLFYLIFYYYTIKDHETEHKV